MFHFSTILIDAQLLWAVLLEIFIKKSMELHRKNRLIFWMQNSKKLLERWECGSACEFDVEFRVTFEEIDNVLSEWSVEMRIEIIPRCLLDTSEIVQKCELEAF